jgi:hypothetical protein
MDSHHNKRTGGKIKMRFKSSIAKVLIISVLIMGLFITNQISFADNLYPLGLKSLHEYIHIKMAPKLYNTSVKLPTSVDLTNQFPPVGNQASLGSCVAFATGYADKTYQEGLDWNWDVHTTNHIFSPAYIYNQIHVDNTPGGGGAYFSAAFNLLQNQGCTTLDDMPYDGFIYGWETQPTSQQRANAANHKVLSWSQLPSGDYNEIKAQIAVGNPVVIGVPVYPDFDNLSPDNPVYDDSSGICRGYHALCVVGYSDSMNAVKIINSWATGWGLSGYGWISYNFIQNQNIEAYIMTDIIDNGEKRLSISPESLNFGNCGIGATGNLTLTLTNTGNQVTTVSSINIDNSEFGHNATLPLTVPAFGIATFDVTFTPASVGLKTGALTINSDAGDNPTLNVPLSGTGVVPPSIAVNPGSFNETLNLGDVVNRTLTIQNDGGEDLQFTIDGYSITQMSKKTVKPVRYSAGHYAPLKKGAVDTRVGNPVIKNYGGPDNYGYCWQDSDEPAGPLFVWNDISGTGTLLSTISNGDDTYESVNLGFNFPFYGNNFDTIYVSSNGYITLGSGSSSYSNYPLPSASAPANLIAGFFDDLYPGAGGDVYYLIQGNKVIVQFNNVVNFWSGGPYTFQMVLESSGSITFYYKSMTAPLNSATVGIQNSTKDDGLTVVYNNDYIKNNLAVRFNRRPQWMTFSPENGTVPAGSQQDITLTFDAHNLNPGNYGANLEISHNATNTTSPVVIPCIMQVNNKVSTPILNLNGGVFNNALLVTVNCATVGADIYYTVNGNEPTENDSLYSSPILIDHSLTLKAKAFKPGCTASDTKTAGFTILGKTNKYQPGDGSALSLVKTAQNFRDSLYTDFNSSSLLVGKGASGKVSDLWLYFPQIIDSGTGQIPGGVQICQAKLALKIIKVNGDQNKTYRLKIYRITDPDNLGAPYFNSTSGIRNGLDFKHRDNRLGSEIPWASGAQNVLSSLILDDTFEFKPGINLVQLDVTKALQAWVNGEPNQGWFLTIDSGLKISEGVEFNGATAVTIADRPSLCVAYVSSGFHPPLAVTGLTAVPVIGSNQVDLSWQNPVADFYGVTIIRKAGAVPFDPFDGDLVYDGPAASCHDSGLDGGTTYFYAAFAYDNLHNYSPKVWIKVIPQTPAAPAMNNPVPGPGSVGLSWSAVSGANTYRIYRQTDGEEPIILVEANVTSYIDLNVLNKTYSYWVTGINDHGEGQVSLPVTATPEVSTALPSAPSGLQLTVLTNTSIRLDWVDNSDNEAEFAIERQELTGGIWTGWVEVTRVIFNTTSFSDTGLLPGNTYKYRVKAVNLAGESGYSTSDQATTFNLPLAPTNLNWRVISATLVKLNWTDTGNETSYRIDILDANGNHIKPSISLLQNTCTCSITGLIPNIGYRVRVAAINALGEAAAETEIITTPADPKHGLL